MPFKIQSFMFLLLLMTLVLIDSSYMKSTFLEANMERNWFTETPSCPTETQGTPVCPASFLWLATVRAADCEDFLNSLKLEFEKLLFEECLSRFKVSCFSCS